MVLAAARDSTGVASTGAGHEGRVYRKCLRAGGMRRFMGLAVLGAGRARTGARVDVDAPGERGRVTGRTGSRLAHVYI